LGCREIVGKFFFSSENFRSKVQNSILGKFKGKIEILSIHDGNVQLSVGKFNFLPPPTFLTHDAADSRPTTE